MIKVTKEPREFWDEMPELCVFCARPTRYWWGGGKIACCPVCSKIHKTKDLPTRKEWMKKEISFLFNY